MEISKRVEKFIQDCTMNCSNEMAFENKDGSKLYHPWLSPDDAKCAVEIAREEVLLNVAEWIEDTFIFSKDAKKDFSQTFNIKLL
jgi:hypothetical protein